MLRVLVITRNFPPLLGGMENLNLHLVDELASRFDVRLIAPEGADAYAPGGMRVTHVRLRPLSLFLLDSARCAIREAGAWRPDIIVAGSGLTAPLALMAARCFNAKAIAYVHGLDLTAPHPIYRALWRPALRRLDGLIANSRATVQLAINIGIPQQRISIVHPGASIPATIDLAGGSRFRAAHGLGSRPILLSVGRLAARKGLCEFVAEVLPLIVKKCPDVVFVVIGTTPGNALFAEAQSPQSIQAAADRGGVGEHVHFLGRVDNATLCDAYTAASVSVFPIRKIPDDPEGFGMVAVESAAYGLPTVAYAVGGVVDAIKEGISGCLIAPGNTESFAEAVVALISEPLCRQKVRAFAEQFSWELFGERLYRAVQC